jgi:hypothetical protein
MKLFHLNYTAYSFRHTAFLCRIERAALQHQVDKTVANLLIVK